MLSRAALALVAAALFMGPALALPIPFLSVAPNLHPGSDPTCGTGLPVTSTHGAGDPALPSLVYAALKTGFRAVVAWETPEPSAATLRVSLNGGGVVTLRESMPRAQHVFVLDRLPIGASLCFTPEGGSPHALRLANAMTAHDGTAYTVNLLVLGNEQPDVPEIESALDGFAKLLHDATDGHVRVGRIVHVHGDLERHNSGWTTCYIAGVILPPRPTCYEVYDVLFTFDAAPVGAASTYADAIRDPDRAIWMNQYHQAGLVDTGDNVAAVLNHEMGHYLFGAMDLYGALTGTDPDCWDPAKGLSVMGGNRHASEYDDAVNRCPNAAAISGYVPTWTLLRQDFPLVPDRAGVIDAGPAGDGGHYARHRFDFLPQAGEPGSATADGGSPGDAGDTVAGAKRIETGITYGGTMPVPLDARDVYAFEARAGDRLQLSVSTTASCPYIADARGRGVSGACSALGASRTTQALATVDGTYHVVLDVGTSPVYEFRVDVL